MLHHISLGVTDIERAARFFDAVLDPLGYVRVWSDLRPGEGDQAVGYGEPGGGDKLALKQVSPTLSVAMPGFHIAFSAQSHSAVIRLSYRSTGGRSNRQRKAWATRALWAKLFRGLRHRPRGPSPRGSVQECGLTPRSSGAPTAGHQARAGGTRYIFAGPGLASCRRRPLSSNVRPHGYHQRHFAYAS